MTFGGLAAWQAWLLLGAAAAAAAWLFLLKVRPPRVIVPSLLLWRKVLDEAREQTLWERIRRAVSLAVTILIAVALAAAIARPSRQVRAASSASARAPRVLIVLDSSWSMLGRTRSGETRWERAVAEARRVAAGAAGSDIAIATTAEGLVEGPTADLSSIDTALDRLQPAGSTASGWPRLSGAEVHFLTDGAVARALDSAVVLHSVFEAADNVGITAFDVRPALDGTDSDEAYVEIGNFGPAQNVRITMTRGAQSLIDRRADMAAGDALRQVVTLPRGGAADLRVRIDAPKDSLPADDEAFGWIEASRPLLVTVVSSQPSWLAPVFAATPGIRAVTISPAGYRPGDENIVIFDRTVPPTPSAKPALYIAPPAGAWVGSTPDRLEPKPQWTTPAAHPLLAGVDPFTFSIERARIYEPAKFTAIARSAAGTPLVWAGDDPGRARAAILAFGPGDSNLAAAPAFPVLIGNAIDWLARPAAPGARRIGRAAFDASVLRVIGPGNVGLPVIQIPGERVAMLRSPGLYTAEAAASRTTFAVNIADPDVSNLSRSTIATSQATVAVGEGISPRPWWLYLIALAFAAVLVEWWTWLRRITV